jgi:hypothetical protein
MRWRRSIVASFTHCCTDSILSTPLFDEEGIQPAFFSYVITRFIDERILSRINRADAVFLHATTRAPEFQPCFILLHLISRTAFTPPFSANNFKLPPGCLKK